MGNATVKLPIYYAVSHTLPPREESEVLDEGSVEAGVSHDLAVSCQGLYPGGAVGYGKDFC